MSLRAEAFGALSRPARRVRGKRVADDIEHEFRKGGAGVLGTGLGERRAVAPAITSGT
jgi:hypothetical protein